jgi:hypothetical protein
VLVESDNGGRQILLGGHPAYSIDDEPVADVNPVISADRHRAGPSRRGPTGVVEDVHPRADYGQSGRTVEPNRPGCLTKPAP